ncbi:hypothetical protein PM082_008911 [Marasmius tenuissimus]|nr:hypothetical protein PM082_008911 [Marasmius tenuissimus]
MQYRFPAVVDPSSNHLPSCILGKTTLSRPHRCDAFSPRDTALAREVTELSLCGSKRLEGPTALGFDVSPDDLELYKRPRKESSLINLDAMKNMTRLRSLELGGRVFGSIPDSFVAREEEYADSDMKVIGDLCELVRGKIPQGLEELAVRNPSTWEGDTGIGVPSDFYARLEGLKVIKWEGTNGSMVQKSLRNLLSASFFTVHTLHLAVHHTTPELDFTKSFPRLRSLTIRSRPGHHAQRSFVDFVLAHDDLTRLDLGHTDTDNTATQAYTDTLHTKTFRNLKSFCGDVNSLIAMLKARLECLATLQRVDIGEHVLYSPHRLDGLEVSGVRFEMIEGFKVSFKQYVGVADLELLVRAVETVLPLGNVLNVEMRPRNRPFDGVVLETWKK